MENQQAIQPQDNKEEKAVSVNKYNGKFGILKQKFNSLTIEQKLNYIAIPALVLVFGGIGFFLYLSNDQDKSNKVSDFSVPDAEVSKYNNKLEAVNAPANDDNITIQPVEPIEQQQAVAANDDAYIEHLSRQIDNSAVQQRPSSYQSSASNAHNVYGDYDMWQTKEPSNSKIGYSNKSNRSNPIVKGNSNTQASTKSDNLEITPMPTMEQSFPTNYQEKKAFSNNQIQLKLLSTGKAVDGTKLTFVMLEPANFGSVEAKKGQAIQGICKEENGRLFVNIQAIKINSKVYPVNVRLLGDDGIEGLAIGGTGGESTKAGTAARSVGSDAANSIARRIPVIGGALGNAIGSGRGGTHQQEPITLTSNTRAILMIY